MSADSRVSPPILRLGLLVCLTLLLVGMLLWFEGDTRHALGVVPLVVLLVCPLLHFALTAKHRHAPT